MSEPFNDINKRLSEEEILGLGTVEFQGKPIDYGSERMVNPSVNSVPDGREYVYPTQEEIINFNIEESRRKGEEKHVRVVCEDFWEDGILDEYYEQLGKEIYQREKDKEEENRKERKGCQSRGYGKNK